MRIRRTIDIAMSNYSEIVGSCVFSYEGKMAYATDNMRVGTDVQSILDAWNQQLSQFQIKGIQFLTAMADSNGLVGINPEGAIAFICGTGKGVWFVSCFAPMDADKNGILKECVQAAKNLETSVSIFEI